MASTASRGEDRVLIQVCGSLNMDLVVVTPRVPGPGETINSTNFSSGYGGKGANQAVAAARLLRQDAKSSMDPSVEVRMIGAVGEDRFGGEIVNHLRQTELINVDGIVVKKQGKTGVAVIAVEEKTAENRIMYTKGANGLLLPSDIVGLSKSSTSHVKQFVLFQLETPLQTVIETIKHAHTLGGEVVLNPAPAVPLPDDIYPCLDHLILNESEAALLSGVPEADLEASIDDVVESFLKKGVRNVIVTLGSKGAYFRSYSDTQGVSIPGLKVNPKDTTAAGDTFVGAYVVYLAQNANQDVAGAIAYANLAAAKSVTREGAQSSMPYRSDLESRPE